MTLDRKHHALLAAAGRRGQIDVDALRLCFEVLSLAAAIDRDCASRLTPHQLSESKFLLLCLLHDRPEGLSPHQLADQAGVTPATMTGLLDGMERDGFITRQNDNLDRRKIIVLLTRKGTEKAEALFDEHTRWIGSLMAGLDANERGTLSALLARVRRNIGVGAGQR